MLHKIKTLVLSLSLMFVAAAPLAVPASTYAVNTITGGACSSINNLDTTGGVNITQQGTATTNSCVTGTPDKQVDTLLQKILNIFSVVVGLAAVVMIVLAGFRYITSGGKEDGVKNAKNTILYAIIGLAIVGLSQIIVQFVLNKTTTV